jgi:hypothetical protein
MDGAIYDRTPELHDGFVDLVVPADFCDVIGSIFFGLWTKHIAPCEIKSAMNIERGHPLFPNFG